MSNIGSIVKKTLLSGVIAVSLAVIVAPAYFIAHTEIARRNLCHRYKHYENADDKVRESGAQSAWDYGFRVGYMGDNNEHWRNHFDRLLKTCD